MKVKSTRWQTNAFTMRRDIRRVQDALRALAMPHKGDVLDVAQVRYELLQMIERIPTDRIDESLHGTIDRFVDTHVTDFLQRRRAEHAAEMTLLHDLRGKISGHLQHAELLLHDEEELIAHYDDAAAHALDRLVDQEKPVTDRRHEPKPRKSKR